MNGSLLSIDGKKYLSGLDADLMKQSLDAMYISARIISSTYGEASHSSSNQGYSLQVGAKRLTCIPKKPDTGRGDGVDFAEFSHPTKVLWLGRTPDMLTMLYTSSKLFPVHKVHRIGQVQIRK